MNLDIAFSDHHLSENTLKAFGAVVAAIRRVCNDDQLRFWSFIHYVSTRHPEMLGVNLAKEQRDRCEAVLTRANPPPVTVEESEEGRMLRGLAAQQTRSEPGSAVDRPGD
jgi:hypothetical protein